MAERLANKDEIIFTKDLVWRMSQEASKWLVNGLFHLLNNGIYWGYNPLMLTLDPNFQGYIQVWRMGCLGHVYPDKRETRQGRIRVGKELKIA